MTREIRARVRHPRSIWSLQLRVPLPADSPPETFGDNAVIDVFARLKFA